MIALQPFDIAKAGLMFTNINNESKAAGSNDRLIAPQALAGCFLLNRGEDGKSVVPTAIAPVISLRMRQSLFWLIWNVISMNMAVIFIKFSRCIRHGIQYSPCKTATYEFVTEGNHACLNVYEQAQWPHNSSHM